MTTKLKHFCSPVSVTTQNAFAVNPEVEAGFHKLRFSMDRRLELHNIETVRRTILMHEEIFKQQVHELHRLYNIQKKLMNEHKNGRTLRKDVMPETNATDSKFSAWHHKTTETGHIFQAFGAREDPREVSGSCSLENSRMTIKFDIERPRKATKSSNHFVEEHKDLERTDQETEVDVELTLSLGHSTRKKRSKSAQFHGPDKSNKVGGLDFSSAKVYGGEEDYGEPSSTISSSSVPLCQDSSGPHWLLQDLSLNKT